MLGYANPGTAITVTAGATATVNATMLPVPSGITATPSVSRTGGKESWSVSGTITVTNDNNVPLTGVTVTDGVSGRGATCVVTGGTGVTITASPAYPAPLVTASFPYTCTYSGPPATGNEIDTATVTWDASPNVPGTSGRYAQPFRFGGAAG